MRIIFDNVPEKLELIDSVNGRWAVRWNFKTLDDGTTQCDQHVFNHKPSIREVESLIIKSLNKDCTNTIESGLVWNGRNVYLNEENQRNINTICGNNILNSDNLPIILKLGTEDFVEYYKFTSVEELKSFYSSVSNHISSTLEDCWNKKSNLNLEEYK